MASHSFLRRNEHSLVPANFSADLVEEDEPQTWADLLEKQKIATEDDDESSDEVSSIHVLRVSCFSRAYFTLHNAGFLTTQLPEENIYKVKAEDAGDPLDIIP